MIGEIRVHPVGAKLLNLEEAAGFAILRTH
jgi:hypothetical protein